MKRKTGIVLALLIIAGCSFWPVSISELFKHPEKYDNHVVTVRGKVVSMTKLPFMKDATYELDDGTGKITIVTLKELPKEGETRTVRGKFKSAFKLMGKSYGFTIREGG